MSFKDPLLSRIKLKSLEEIIQAARECVHRHRRRFLQRNLRPCPGNCKRATVVGHEVVGCNNCGSSSSTSCLQPQKFTPLFTKEELAKQFAEQLRDPDILLRDYRDITVFFFVLSAFEKQQPDEEIIAGVEKHKVAKRGEK